jgi:hypothetical protein
LWKQEPHPAQPLFQESKMNRKFVASLAAAVVGAVALVPSAAQAGGVSWGVSFGVPGFAAFAGQPAFGWGPPPLVAAPAPVFVAPPVVVPRRVVVAPAPVFVPAPVIVRQVRWHRHRPVIVYRSW